MMSFCLTPTPTPPRMGEGLDGRRSFLHLPLVGRSANAVRRVGGAA